jgi:hypothetical protein
VLLSARYSIGGDPALAVFLKKSTSFDGLMALSLVPGYFTPQSSFRWLEFSSNVVGGKIQPSAAGAPRSEAAVPATQGILPSGETVVYINNRWQRLSGSPLEDGLDQALLRNVPGPLPEPLMASVEVLDMELAGDARCQAKLNGNNVEITFRTVDIHVTPEAAISISMLPEDTDVLNGDGTRSSRTGTDASIVTAYLQLLDVDKILVKSLPGCHAVTIGCRDGKKCVMRQQISRGGEIKFFGLSEMNVVMNDKPAQGTSNVSDVTDAFSKLIAGVTH